MLDGSNVQSQLLGIPSAHIEVIWPQVEPLIAMACKRSGRDSSEGYKKRLLAQEQQLWVSWNSGVEAILITQILTFLDTGVKVCRWQVCTGKSRHNWAHFRDQIGEWAKSEGCSEMDFLSRPGWRKELPEFKKVHDHLVKKL